LLVAQKYCSAPIHPFFPTGQVHHKERTSDIAAILQWAFELIACYLCHPFHQNDHHAESFSTEMTLQVHSMPPILAANVGKDFTTDT
jgi:hypothetical protein